MLRRMDEPRRKITARLVRPGQDAEAFDIEFWSQIPGERRVAALWGMTLEAFAFREGDNGQGEPRLQRSVLVVRRP
jgi:hypothetical protein